MFGVQDLQAMYDDEVKTRDSIAEAAARSERKCNDLQGEIEDLRATMEQVRQIDTQFKLLRLSFYIWLSMFNSFPSQGGDMLTNSLVIYR